MNPPVAAAADPDAIRAAVAAARAGDAQAFAQLYRQTHRRVYALCVRLLGDRGLAEDVLQEVYVRAWQALPGFRGEARFGTWLHRIAVHAAVSAQRRRWLPWARRGVAGAPDTGAAGHPEPADPAPSPALQRDLEAAIATLPARARMVFVLVDIEGHTHEETAQMLGVTTGTSKSHLHRARQLLRQRLLGSGRP